MLDFPMFAIITKHDNRCRAFISAKNSEWAWSKFVTQNFDALKPAPDDYEIKEAQIEHQWGPDGFIVLEHATRQSAFAYESSPLWELAKKEPKRAARECIHECCPVSNDSAREEQYVRLHQKLLASNKIKHVVACTNANGESDFFFCYAKDAFEAISKAEEEGYEMPFIVFDEQDRCFKNGLENLFQWESLK
jgi:hypothetical protein